MITLTLLHPIQSIPVQSWTFEHESVIRIGRSTDNHVILYSAVVSRHHVELRQSDSQWEVVNLGANGTYLDGKRITQEVPVVDGIIIRLARSGPNIQIHIGQSASGVSQNLTGDNTLAQRIKSRSQINQSTSSASPAKATDASIPVTRQPEDDPDSTASGKLPTTDVDVERVSAPDPSPVSATQTDSTELLFSQESGQPLKVLYQVGEYQVLKTLNDDGIGLTQVAWRNGQSLLLRTLRPEWVNHPKAPMRFEQQAKVLLPLNHPRLPRFLDYFSANGQPYLFLEWIHGQTLTQQVAQQPLSQPDAIAILLQVCDVLGYLHQLPLVHGDLKPDNLIQRPASFSPYTVALVGFVSLKDLTTGTQLAATGYAAPEQQFGQLTPAVDLFALGPILVYLLTGKEPSEFYTQREQGFRLYPENVPGLSPELVEIVRKLTNPHPSDRYSSAQEVAAALRQLL